MISQVQIAQRRLQATQLVETAFATTITIGAHADLPAARWTHTTGADPEMAGLLGTHDIIFRVRTEVLTGITIEAERTIITEAGKNYRVKLVRSALGDPALVLACKAV